MKTNKLRVIKDYEKLEPEIQEQLKLLYPKGFSQNLIEFTNKDGETVSALPYETEDKIYLIRMSINKAKQIIHDDIDYDDEGHLKDEAREKYEDDYGDDSDSEDDSRSLDYYTQNEEGGDDDDD